MSSYKKNTSSNRDALFGGAAGGGGGGSGGRGSRPAASSTTARPSPGGVGVGVGSNRTNTAAGYRGARTTTAANSTNKASRAKPVLSGEAKQAKMSEAEEYKAKANKCMQKGFFSKPDPVAASTYYKRAADAYQSVGDEPRLERLYRLESASCNRQTGAWASAAGDYARAAELILLESADPRMTATDRAKEASKYHKLAGTCWTQMHETAKAASCQVEAAVVLQDPDDGDGTSSFMSKEVLTALEEAVEAHVPDVLNRYGTYRQTGSSAFLDADKGETLQSASPETKSLAEQHVVTKAYAHEPVQKVVDFCTAASEYASALYAAGAVTCILEREGLSSLTLSRAYAQETVLTLCMGDPVLAERQFLEVHVQKTAYLSSRECKLSEDLFRAIKQRDQEALDEARDVTGSNRAALANMASAAVQNAVQYLRVSGVAKKQSGSGKTADRETTTANASKKSSSAAATAPASAQQPEQQRPLQDLMSMKTGYEAEAAEGANLDSNALSDELDALDFGGLSDSDDDNKKDKELDDLEDDDIDLR